MFTDGPTTPLRVEFLVDLLRSAGPHDANALGALLQPGHEKKDATRQTILAARELALIMEADSMVAYSGPESATTREAALQGFDQIVLTSPETEPYLARYYAYLLGLGKKAEGGAPETLLAAFVAQMSLESRSNPFNRTKEAALSRWFMWAGLGWVFDSDFVCNPYERIERSLSLIFAGESRLRDGEFLVSLGRVCPELDGGRIYREVWPDWSVDEPRFTLGVSHALIDLHVTGRIVLHAPPDSRGWSIEDADPPNDGENLRGSRVDFVELRGTAQ